MGYFTLARYDVRDAPDHQVKVFIKGDQVYRAVLESALPSCPISRAFVDRFEGYDWVVYIHNIDDETKGQLLSLLDVCQQHIYIEDDLSQTFALALHTENFGRSEMGELVYAAKPYHRVVTQLNHDKAAELAQHLAAFIQQHPNYRQAQIIIPTPPSKTGKPFDLPSVLASSIAQICGIEDGTGYVRKARSTGPMKDFHTIEEKISNIRNAFDIHPDVDLSGYDVLLLDDIYQSGSTLNEVGRVLFDAGAENVFGLVATKTWSDI